jgi:excisionase family DNA binding protein
MTTSTQGPPRKRGTARRNSEAQSRARHTGPVLSVAHSAKYLDVSRNTVYRMIEAGELVAFKVAGHDALRIAVSDLDAYISRQIAS